MSKKAKKKASKRTTKRTAKKRTTKRVAKGRTTRRRRRTPAQIRATKKLVAANRARAKARRGGPSTRRRVAKKVRRKSQAYWSKWASKQPERRDVEGRLMYQGPMTPAQDVAMRRAMNAMGLSKAEVYRGSSGELVLQAPLSKKQTRQFKRSKRHGARRGFVGPLPPREHLAAVAHKKQFGVKYEKLRQQYFKSKRRPTVTAAGMLKKAKAPTTAAGILSKATKEAKYSRLKPIMTQKTTKNAALWICGNPSGKRTGCGGGVAKRRGSRVVGILA